MIHTVCEAYSLEAFVDLLLYSFFLSIAFGTKCLYMHCRMLNIAKNVSFLLIFTKKIIIAKQWKREREEGKCIIFYQITYFVSME
jgi:hypothetical protein